MPTDIAIGNACKNDNKNKYNLWYTFPLQNLSNNKKRDKHSNLVQNWPFNSYTDVNSLDKLNEIAIQCVFMFV